MRTTGPRIVDRHLLAAIGGPFLLALVSLVSVLGLVAVARTLSATVGLGMTGWDLAELVGLSLVLVVVPAAPLAWFFAVLLGLSRLDRDKELDAYFAAGLTRLGLVRAPLAASALLSLALLGLAHGAQPWAAERLYRAAFGVAVKNLAAGASSDEDRRDRGPRGLELGPGLGLFAEGVGPDGAWRGVALHREAGERGFALFADRARVVVAEGAALHLEAGRLEPVGPGPPIDFARAELSLVPRRDQLRFADSLHRLPSRTLYARAQAGGPDAPRLLRDLLRRFVTPSLALGLAFLGLGLALAAPRRAMPALALLALAGTYALVRAADAAPRELALPLGLSPLVLPALVGAALVWSSKR